MSGDCAYFRPKVKGLGEQLDVAAGSQQTRKFAKRRSSRSMRRAAKQDPENVPTKRRYRGYVS